MTSASELTVSRMMRDRSGSAACVGQSGGFGDDAQGAARNPLTVIESGLNDAILIKSVYGFSTLFAVFCKGEGGDTPVV
jgi:hypothetical protein